MHRQLPQFNNTATSCYYYVFIQAIYIYSYKYVSVESVDCLQTLRTYENCTRSVTIPIANYKMK